MRKTILLAAFAAVAGAGAAQAQSADVHPPRQGAAEGRGGPGGRRGGGDAMLLRGITLTDAQKAKLAEIHKAERAKQGEGRGAGRPDFDAIRAAREKGDTATAKRLMAEQRAKMEARRAEQTAALRSILTAEQRTQFDANLAELKKHQAQGGARHGKGDHKPGDRAGR